MDVLVIPDLHCPFEHPHAIDFLADVRRRYKPTNTICIGDEADFHNFSRFPRDVEAIGPNEELDALRRSIGRLAKVFPVLTICESNHTYRPFRKAAGAGLPAGFMGTLRSILGAPEGWFWVRAAHVDYIAYEHGEGFSGADGAMRAATSNMVSTVIGHIHSHAGVRYRQFLGGRIFGFNVGCLIDATQPAFAYGKYITSKPVLGCGVVTDGVPQFIPLP